MAKTGHGRCLTLALALLFILPPSLAAGARQEVVPAGSPATDPVQFQFAIYYLPAPDKDPLKILRARLAKDHPELKFADSLPSTTSAMSYVSARMETQVRDNYAPPDIRALQYFGRGLSPTQAQSLQSSRQALVLDFRHSAKQALAALRSANRLAESIARETNGLLWDEETREVFTSDAWADLRLKTWDKDLPNVSKQIVIHAYKSGDLVRTITLGMAKLGLPDVVVDDSPWSVNVPVSHLINLFCQAMAEGGTIGSGGSFDLDLRAIQHTAVRESQLGSLLPNASGIAKLALVQGLWEEGDPRNRLFDIRFDRYAGPDVHAKQERLLSTFLGTQDSIVRVTHSEEILAASRRASAKLPGLRDAFNAGLAPGEHILLKAPFPTHGGGNEWMWVEVMRWKEQTIEGLLRNEPAEIPGLHAGQIVTIRQESVFDYLRRRPDGSEEGNETGHLMR